MSIDSKVYKVFSIVAGVTMFLVSSVYIYRNTFIDGGIAIIVSLIIGSFFFIIFQFYALVLERLENIEKLLQSKDN